MTDPMTAARGVLTLLGESVPEARLETARTTVEYGYPLLAVIYALSVVHEERVPISDDIRRIVLTEFSWPHDELEVVMSELSQIPRLAA
jgi:hypothetical protein